MTSTLWETVWQECHDETKTRQPTFDDADYYRSGRPSKAWPDKETPAWWAENGPRFVELWTLWRDNCGLEIWEYPDENGELDAAIELELHAYSGDDRDLIVRSVIDRVMTDGDNLYVVDLKTGSMTQPWPLQLALNDLCLRSTFGQSAKWGGFWSARKGTVEHWHDLSIYSDDLLWDWVWKAREIRDQHLFIPNPNNLCKSACGVSQHCPAMGGTPFFPADATLTRN